jgi:hypothetical protein
MDVSCAWALKFGQSSSAHQARVNQVFIIKHVAAQVSVCFDAVSPQGVAELYVKSDSTIGP